MSPLANIASHQDQIIELTVHVQDKIMKCESGRQMQEISGQLSQSPDMLYLMHYMAQTDQEKEKLLLFKYLGKIISHNPENGLKNFSDYLLSVASDPKYQSRSDYYLNINDHVERLLESTIFNEYVKYYNNFMKDNSQEAIEARAAMQYMQQQIEKISNNS